MKDANGRRVEVGDWVASPLPRLEDLQDTELLVRLPELIAGAVLGRVVEIGEDFEGEFVYLGDGIIYGPEEIVTLAGLEWVTCPECGDSWPFDVRMNAEEECPYCDHLLTWPTDEHLIPDPLPISDSWPPKDELGRVLTDPYPIVDDGGAWGGSPDGWPD